MTELHSKNEFIYTRTFNAPVNIVWKAYTEANQLIKWWGPKGFIMNSCSMQLHEGGVFHYFMQSPEGYKMWGKLVYRQIVPLKQLVFVVSFSNENGGISRHPMSATWPLEVLNTLLFTAADGNTTLTLTAVPINASEEEIKTFIDGREGMKVGFNGMLDQLDGYLASLQAKV